MLEFQHARQSAHLPPCEGAGHTWALLWGALVCTIETGTPLRAPRAAGFKGASTIAADNRTVRLLGSSPALFL